VANAIIRALRPGWKIGRSRQYVAEHALTAPAQQSEQHDAGEEPFLAAFRARSSAEQSWGRRASLRHTPFPSIDEQLSLRLFFAGCPFRERQRLLLAQQMPRRRATTPGRGVLTGAPVKVFRTDVCGMRRIIRQKEERREAAAR